jgi:hypothetical protein
VAEAAKQQKPLVLGAGMSSVLLREGFTRARPNPPNTAFSATVGAASVVYTDFLGPDLAVARTDRSMLRAHLGGGGAGLDGKLHVESAVGVRGAFSRHHGPLLRLGARGWLEGNDRFYSSLIELPSVQAGYQLFRRAVLFELAAQGGVALVGRFNVEDAPSRALGQAWTYGGHGALHWRRVLLNATWSRIEAGSRPVSVLRVQLCGAAYWLLLCTELDRFAGVGRVRDGASPRSVDQSVLIGGFSLGVGQHAEPHLTIAH